MGHGFHQTRHPSHLAAEAHGGRKLALQGTRLKRLPPQKGGLALSLLSVLNQH